MQTRLLAGICLVAIAFADYPHAGHVGHGQPFPHSIRRVDHHHVSHHQLRPLVRTERRIPHLHPLRGLFGLVDQSRRRSQRIPSRLVKNKGHARRPVHQKKSRPGIVPNFIYLDAEQMPGYEKFEDHEIVRNGQTTASPYLIKHLEKAKPDYSELIDERSAQTEISAEKNKKEEEKEAKEER